MSLLYCRLSKDDMAQGDSESIKTQKAMLTQYAREHGFLVVETYVDDGWSGLNFSAAMSLFLLAVSTQSLTAMYLTFFIGK